MFCNYVLCAMAIKHQERITAANADGNILSSNSFYHVYFKGKKKEKKTVFVCSFTNKQNLKHFLNVETVVCKTMSETFYDLIY